MGNKAAFTELNGQQRMTDLQRRRNLKAILGCDGAATTQRPTHTTDNGHNGQRTWARRGGDIDTPTRTMATRIIEGRQRSADGGAALGRNSADCAVGQTHAERFSPT